MDELDSLGLLEGLDNLFALAGPHEAGIDEHAGQLGPDGLVHKGRGDRRVDPSGQSADGPSGANLSLIHI